MTSLTFPLISSTSKEEKSQVQLALDHWQEQSNIQHTIDRDDRPSNSNPECTTGYSFDESAPPPPGCFSLHEDVDLAATTSSVTLAAQAALRSVDLRSRDNSLQPDDQATVYDKVHYCHHLVLSA